MSVLEQSGFESIPRKERYCKLCQQSFMAGYFISHIRRQWQRTDIFFSNCDSIPFTP